MLEPTTVPFDSTSSVAVAAAPATARPTTEPAVRGDGDPGGVELEGTVDDDPTTASAAPAEACTTAGCSGTQLVPFATLTDVPQLGEDPVRGSGCGLADEFGNSMPDGLYFGLLYPERDAVGFDVECVYYGDAAVDKGADPGPSSDFFPVNNATRRRDVPLAADFTYRTGTSTPAGECVDAGPEGDLAWDAVEDGTAAWLTITGGDATGAVAMCPP